MGCPRATQLTAVGAAHPPEAAPPVAHPLGRGAGPWCGARAVVASAWPWGRRRAGPSVSLTCRLPKGEPLPAHQDPRGLLLLRVRPDPAQERPRPLLRGDGPGHDRHYHVSAPGGLSLDAPHALPWETPRACAAPLSLGPLCRGCRDPARRARGGAEEVLAALWSVHDPPLNFVVTAFLCPWSPGGLPSVG